MEEIHLKDLNYTANNLPKSLFKKVVKKRIPIHVAKIGHDFSVDTLEGTVEGKAGDYLAIGIVGERYPIDKTICENSYEDWTE